MLNKKHFVTLLTLLLILFVLLTLTILVFSLQKYTFAEEYVGNVDIYLENVTDHKQIKYDLVASIPYYSFASMYYKYGTVSDTDSTSLNYYFTQYYTNFRVENSSGKQIEGTVVDGNYVSYSAIGAPTKIIVYPIFIDIQYHNIENAENNSFNYNYVHKTEKALFFPATKDDYSFDGWYLDEALTQQVSQIAYQNTTIHVYAKWVEPIMVKTILTDKYHISSVTGKELKLNKYDLENYCVTKEDILSLYSGSIITSFTFNESNPTYDSQRRYYFFKNMQENNVIKAVVDYKSTLICGTIQNANIYVENVHRYNNDITYFLYATSDKEIVCLLKKGLLGNVLDEYSTLNNVTVFDESNSNVVVTQTISGNDILYSFDAHLYKKLSSINLYITKSQYSISYELNGGINNENNPDIYHKNDEITLYTPIKDGFVFNGWYLEPSLETKVENIDTTVPYDITLYAGYSQVYNIEVTLKKIIQNRLEISTVESISSYLTNDNTFYLIGGENSQELYDSLNLHNVYSYIIYDNNENVMESHIDGTNILCSYLEDCYPQKMTIYTPYYRVIYHTNGGLLSSDFDYYYTSDEDLIPLSVTKTNCHFLGWYTDENFTENYLDSSFKADHNLDLYAKWVEVKYVDLYLLKNDGSDEKELLSRITYYPFLDTYYIYGENEKSILQSFLDTYDTNTFFVKTTDGKSAKCTVLDGKFASYIQTGEPESIYIYKYCTANFYVNGILYQTVFGEKNKPIPMLNNISGYLGTNYDALTIGDSLTFGNKYALYTFAGWSLTDSTDRNWFKGDSYKIVNDTQVFTDLNDYNVNYYAVMYFYKKVSDSTNNELDYESILQETKGVILKDYKYTLDDLVNERVVVNPVVKNHQKLFAFAEKIGIDTSSQNWELFITVLDGENITFAELTKTNTGIVIISLIGAVSAFLFFTLLTSFISQITIVVNNVKKKNNKG